MCDYSIEAWSEVVTVATHFNEMLMSTRSIVAGITPALVGAAGLSLVNLKPKHAFFLWIHLGVYVIFAGLALLFIMFKIDYNYYFELLLSTVDTASQIEAACQNVPNLTIHLSDRVSAATARELIKYLYGGVAFMLIVLIPIIQFKGMSIRKDELP